MSSLKITSHVGRDILQSAQLFKTPEAAVWEYVVNSLQYLDPGVVPNVRVTLDKKAKTITIADNGAGMNRSGLEHFFTMHGENRERRKGVPGRGKFGTGKSAAFGIGSALAVDTVRGFVRQKVYVDRSMIDAAGGSEVPIRFDAADEPAPTFANGTTITISGVSVKMVREPVIALIERHLAAFRSGAPVVTVNGSICEVRRPAAPLSRSFTPPPTLAPVVGDITLTIYASLAPLQADQRGVQVTVGQGNLVAVESAGIDIKEYGNRIFGEVDCPNLDDPRYDPVAAYGNNRDLTLNKSHPVALALTAFIGASMEQVRSELVDDARKARAEAENARLRATTSAIENVLNADLAEMRDRLEAPLANVRRPSTLPAKSSGAESYDTNHVVDPDGEGRGDRDSALGGNEATPEPVEDEAPPAGDNAPSGSAGLPTEPTARPGSAGKEHIAQVGGGGRIRPSGGLSVNTGHFGEAYDRYNWDKDSRVITINLDHPVVVAARGMDDNETSFRRLCYEIAFTSYAIALTDLQLERDAAMDASDAMYEVRQTLSRVWMQAGVLYSF